MTDLAQGLAAPYSHDMTAPLIDLEELDRLCSSFIRLGVKKLRITGGEPLVRRDIMTFFRGMSRHLESAALEELTLTTNGSQLEKYASDLAAVGVKRINVSLDTLDEKKFADITRWGRLPQVIRGIDAAQKAGLRVKINTVALSGFNEDELFALTDWCASRDMDITFIEVMPMGDIGNEDRITQYWSLKDLRARLAARTTLTDLPDQTGGPARYVQLDNTGQKANHAGMTSTTPAKKQTVKSAATCPTPAAKTALGVNHCLNLLWFPPNPRRRHPAGASRATPKSHHASPISSHDAGIRCSTISAHHEHPAGIASSLKL